jgi:hypothetical protein
VSVAADQQNNTLADLLPVLAGRQPTPRMAGNQAAHHSQWRPVRSGSPCSSPRRPYPPDYSKLSQGPSMPAMRANRQTPDSEQFDGRGRCSNQSAINNPGVSHDCDTTACRHLHSLPCAVDVKGMFALRAVTRDVCSVMFMRVCWLMHLASGCGSPARAEGLATCI